MPKVYTIDDPAPNAFATGRNKDHAAVVVTTGLLGLLNKTELEGVIAHELSHIGNRDILLSTIIVVLVGFVAILADMFRRSLWFGGMRRNNDRESSGGIFMLIGIILSIFAPIAVTPHSTGYFSKKGILGRCFWCSLTRYPEGLASALEKIGQYHGKFSEPILLPLTYLFQIHLVNLANERRHFFLHIHRLKIAFKFYVVDIKKYNIFI
jgi:heat shock protein HtpX